MAPATPHRSFPNGVVYSDPAALEAALDELAGAYEQAGVLAWTVWVPEADLVTANLLARAGHALDATPAAMVADLRGVERPPPERLALRRDVDLRTLAAVNDRAYGTTGDFLAMLGDGRPPSGHVYGAQLGDEVAAVLWALDHEDDCHVSLVATVPEARGRGLALGLMRHALADAAERGAATSTLQATAMGRPLYERLGYRDLGPLQMWERRRAAPGPP